MANIFELRRPLPNLLIEVDILKIEDVADYLLLGKGDLVVASCKLDHPMLACQPLARGRLKCIVPHGHPLARRARVTAREIVKFPLIGVDANDPHGRIMVGLFARHALHHEVSIRARFGTTVCALVQARLGIAVIDQFSVAHGSIPGVKLLEIREPTRFDTFVAIKRGAQLSPYAMHFIACLRAEMEAVEGTRRARPANHNMRLSLPHK